MNQIYRPKFDKYYGWIIIPTLILIVGMTVGLAIPYLPSLFFTIPTLLFCLYFFASPFFGYVELREECVFVRLGFFMTREIPYRAIRGLTKERKFYADSMVSLKNALDHVNIKYNRFDIISVSVSDNDEMIRQIEARCLMMDKNTRDSL